MTRPIHFVAGLAAVLTAGLLAGCSVFSAKPDRSQFFLLSPMAAKDAPTPPLAPDVAIGVFAPAIPSYLDRPQMVARLGENQVSVNEFQRWAEPLGTGIGRVLMQDISLVSGSDKVALFPMTRAYPQEFELYTTVSQFDGMTGGEVKLKVIWRLTGPNGRPEYLVKESSFSETAVATPNPYTGYVDALNLLLGDLAKEVTAAVPQARAAMAAKKAADEQAAAQAKLIQQATQTPPPTQNGTALPPMVVPGAR